MNEVQIFNNAEFGEIRTVVIDGEPWFVAKDISEKLGYVKPANMVKLIDEDDRRNISGSILEPSAKTPYKSSVINESGLYAAIFGSKQENAKKFKKWVTSEVLPSIRKTGGYQMPKSTMELLELHYQALKEVNEKVENVSAEVDGVKSELNSLKMDLPILPIEAERITAAVRKKGVEVLGGKDSNAYHNRGLQQKVYRDIYGTIKHNFGDVTTYKAIKRCQTDKVVEIIERYEPPLFLAEQIDEANAQQTLDL